MKAISSRLGMTAETLRRWVRQCEADAGEAAGIHAERLLTTSFLLDPDAGVYRLLGLTRRYGDTAANTVCGKALQVDVVCVAEVAYVRIASPASSYDNAASCPQGHRRPTWSSNPRDATARHVHDSDVHGGHEM
jgi:hypothetical protein